LSTLSWAETVTYTYDNLHRLIKVEYDDGTVIEYTYDAAGNRASQKVTIPNLPPTANAGPDQTVECTSPSGANVMLDGSASSDPNGDALTFTWTGSFGTASDPKPTVPLSLGGRRLESRERKGENKCCGELSLPRSPD